MCGGSRARGGAKIYRKLKVKREEPASQDVFERDYGDDGDLALWAYGKNTLTPPSPSKQKAKLNLSGRERERSSKARFNPPKTGIEIKLMNFLAKHWCACLFFKAILLLSGRKEKEKIYRNLHGQKKKIFLSHEPKLTNRKTSVGGEKREISWPRKIFCSPSSTQKVIFSSFSRKSPSLASFVVSWYFLCVTT